MVDGVVVAASIAVGGLLAIQARIIGEVGRLIGDGYLAAVVSISVGLVLLTAAVGITRSGRDAPRRWWTAITGADHPRWYFLGGACGAVLVLAQGLAVAALGIALFSIAVVAGQSVSGLVVDRRGLGVLAPQAITWPRRVGMLLMIVAVVWAVSGQLSDTGGWAWLTLPIAAGLLLSIQQAVNGQVRVITGSILITTWANFAIALALLLLAFVVHGTLAGWPTAGPTSPWMYLGGPLGIAYIAGVSVFVHRVGVLLLGLCSTAGQLLGSLLLDVVVPPPGHTLAWTTVAGACLAVAALLVATIRSPQRLSPTSAS